MTKKTIAEQAKIDPQAQFASPMHVVHDGTLTHAQKLEILRSWELDARELQTAEDENMAGGEASRLAEVRSAIDQLEQSEPDSPTSG
jgi:hypothetical protein